MDENQDLSIGSDLRNPLREEKKTLNLSAISIIVLAIALLVIYVLYFTQKRSEVPAVQQRLFVDTLGQELRIAFVNSDSIMIHYELVKDLRKKLESSSKRKEGDLKSKQKVFEDKVADYQQKLNTNAITIEIAQITEQQLMQEQQRLVDLRDQLADELAYEEYELNVQLLDSVTNFLKRYNQFTKYDVVLNYKHGSTAFVVNEALDITNMVLEQLNTEYGQKPVKK